MEKKKKPGNDGDQFILWQEAGGEREMSISHYSVSLCKRTNVSHLVSALRVCSTKYVLYPIKLELVMF